MIEGALSAATPAVTAPAGRTLLDMNAYQWTVLFAAWLGWGFDIFDSLLFNYVAPNAVPVLLDIPLGTPAARAATLQWTGILTSLLLIGWAVGGIIFGRVADRLGRTRTLLLTMMMYAIGTAACAFAPNMATLVFFRIIASLGIGGEWAAGAAMVAEVVPEHRRVEAGALLYTAAPFGLFLATIVTYQVQGVYFAGSPEDGVALRVPLRPAAGGGGVPRAVVRQGARAVEERGEPRRASAIRELFTPQYRAITISGLLMAVVALDHVVELQRVHLGRGDRPRSRSGRRAAAGPGDGAGRELEADGRQLVQHRRAHRHAAHGAGVEVSRPPHDVRDLFPRVGSGGAGGVRPADGAAHAAVHVFPDRAVGVRRVRRVHVLPARAVSDAAARHGRGVLLQRRPADCGAGPFLVGAIASRGAGALGGALEVLFYVGFVPLLGLLVMPWVMETKGKVLAD